LRIVNFAETVGVSDEERTAVPSASRAQEGNSCFRYEKIFGGLSFFCSFGCHTVEIGSNHGDRIRVCWTKIL